MPKVLRIINRFNLGGPTFNAVHLTKHLPQDFETLLIGGDKEPGEDSSGFIAEDLGVNPLILPELQRELSLPNDRKAYKRIKQIIREFKPDVVHTHASKAGAVGRLAAYEMKVPVIVHTFHGHVFHSYFGPLKTRFYKEVERYLARRSDAIVAISPIQKSELVHEHRIVAEEKVHVIQLGFDLDRFNENKEQKRKIFREEFGLTDDHLAVGIIGRLAPVKNHGLFLEMCAKVKNSLPNARFFIVGDGEELTDIQKKAALLGLSVSYKQPNPNADVVITSWRRDTDVIYAGLDIVTLTSLNEGTPVTLIEAQAAGVPIVTTDVGGVKDVVCDQTAMVATAGDLEHLTNSVLMLANSTELRQDMAMHGWPRVRNHFHYQRLANDVSALYRQLLSVKQQ